jgi:hypothetical protein
VLEYLAKGRIAYATDSKTYFSINESFSSDIKTIYSEREIRNIMNDLLKAVEYCLNIN